MKSEECLSTLLTYILVVVFGTGSWVAINGIWVELPSLVNHTPEKWKLGTYLTIMCQLANIGPIIYYILIKKIVTNKTRLLHCTIYILLIIGFLACILLSLFWRKTTYIGTERSTALLSLTFVLALVDCTSSVTFLPFMSNLPVIFMSSFYVGETFSGFIPSLIALAQGVDYAGGSTNATNSSAINNIASSAASNGLKFPQEIFFLVLAFLVLSCFCSFIALNFLCAVKRMHVAKKLEIDNIDTNINDVVGSLDSTPLISTANQQIKYDPKTLKLLLAWLTILNLIQNGVISGVSTFACAPYGSMTFHLVATIGGIASAFSCFIYLWLPNKSVKIISLMSTIYILLSMYVLVIAIQSPNPLWKDKFRGKALILAVTVLASAMVAYSKLSIASIMRIEGRKYLFYAGVANQVGSFIGALSTFFVVAYTNVFQSN